MPLRSNWSDRPCPIARALDILGDPWVMLVLREVLYGVRRFDDIRDNLEVSDKTLSVRLEQMIGTGLIKRKQYSGTARPRYEYLPTESAEAALPLLHALSQWGASEAGQGSTGERLTVVCLSCGAHDAGIDRCRQCDGDLTPETTAWIRPTSVDRVPHPLGRPAGTLPKRSTDLPGPGGYPSSPLGSP